ncbi:MAG: hypothetical protein JXR37_19080 [Kiritimatiellae bacterium]|nr:hypothetical protein [Kiritimatiellia bacterium]
MAAKQQAREPDDGRLLAEFDATGAEQAFRALVERHTAMVYGICRRGMPRPAVAAELGCSQAALDKRIARSLGTLRTRLSRYGATVSAGALALHLGECAAEAAPADLAAACQTAALGAAAGSAAPGTAGLMAKGALRMMTVAKAKAAAAVAGAVLATSAAGVGGVKYAMSPQPAPAPPADSAQSQPHMKRVGPNLIPNPAVTGMTGWRLAGDAAYEPALSRNAGSGCFRLTSPYRWTKDGADPKTSKATADLVPVTPNRTYTFALYMRSTHVARWLTLRIDHFDRAKRQMKTAKGHYRFEQQHCGNSVPQRWEETAMEFRTASATHYVQIKLLPWNSEDNTGHIWVDDFYFGEGLGFEQPPSRKTPFAGSLVRVDALGNYEVNRDGQWVPFFLWGVFKDNARGDWSIYSDQGWNCIMDCTSVTYLEKCRAAKSVFNPDGVFGCFSVSSYVNPKGWAYGNWKGLSADLQAIKDAGLMDRVFTYFWDNENSWDVWQPNLDAVALIRKADTDAAGRRMHPITVLQGTYNTARAYAKAGLSDAVGSYVGTGRPGADGGWEFGTALLDNIEGQISLVSFANITETGPLSAGAFRAKVYNAILAGAKGITYWRDCFNERSRKEFPNNLPIDEQPWWPEFPTIRREVDRLLPLIRRPHWTAWRVTASTNQLRFGTRDFQRHGYIVIQNPGSKPINAEFRIDGLPYKPAVVKDFLTGATLAPATANTFHLDLAGYQTRVCRLE